MYKYLIFVLLFTPCSVFSDVSESQVVEVKHLLAFIKNSKCNLVRNSDVHTGEIVAKHIEKKYNYFRDDIKNTEEFIEYAATKSTLSGIYYMVNCPGGKSIKAQDWLAQELQSFRNAPTLKNKLNIKATACKNPRPQICTMEYLPVCAQLDQGKIKTYASACSACADKNVKSYVENICLKK
jgi:Family of unknown function (DUF5329)